MARSPARKLGRGLASIKPTPPPMLPGDEPQRGVGDNSMGALNAFERLQLRKDELVATASAWLNNFSLARGKPIDTEENAARLKGFKSQAAELIKDGEKQRKADWKPLKDEIAEIGDAYTSVLHAPTMILETIEPLLRNWLQREQKKLDDAAAAKRAAAEEERKRAEALQAEALRLMDKDDLSGSDTNTMATIIAADEAAAAAKKAAIVAERAQGQRAKVGAEFQVGGVKRSASLRTHYEYRVDDAAAAATALCAMHPDGKPKAIVEAIISVARYLHAQDRTRRFPGVTILEEERAQ